MNLAGLLVAIGGAVALAGVFLPWVSASGYGRSASDNGISLGAYGTIIMSALALLHGGAMVSKRLPPSGWSRTNPIVDGVLILVFMAIRWGKLTEVIDAARAVPGVSAGFGIGIWMVIAGAVAVLAGGALLKVRPS